MENPGLYIHIPFCKSKCVYCDFNSYRGIEDIAEEYCNMVTKEIELFGLENDFDEYKIQTIYIGGGTPSYIPAQYLKNIMDVIYDRFTFVDELEFTIEANPGTLDIEKLSIYKDLGVNRLSMGLQAWQDIILKSMGRIHNAQDFINSMEYATSVGINNISCDLIFGYPGQTLEDWHETLENVLQFNLPHLSCYSLKIEEGTPLNGMIDAGTISAPDEDDDRQMYYDAVKTLGLKGYEHYEISNFCKRGMHSRHNMIYWDGLPYLGFGAGAHSFFNNTRYSNKRNPYSYIKDLKEHKLPLEESRKISVKELASDYVFLRLRLLEGLKYKDYMKRFSADFKVIYQQQITKLFDKGLILMDNDGIRLSQRGLDFANQVFIEFI